MPLALILVIICLEILIEFVEGVVGEMGKKVLLSRQVRRIRDSRKPCQSILVDINPQRIPACDAHINPHIEFQTVGQ